MKHVSIFILFFLLGCSFVQAQDPHFSQFFASPLTLNPAFTGKFNGTVRVAGNYRNQWPEINRAYVTNTASVDFQIMQKNILLACNFVNLLKISALFNLKKITMKNFLLFTV